jgi:hypothetical protein
MNSDDFARVARVVLPALLGFTVFRSRQNGSIVE